MARLDFSGYREVLRTPGAPWFTLAGWVGRFPRGTLNLGITLLVQVATGSFALAGAVAAAYVVGMAVAGPLWSRLMDRRGQRSVLLAAAATLAVSTAVLVSAVLAETPVVLWFVLSFVAGAVSVDVGPAVRARWSALVAPDRRHSAYALESIADESVFVIAPPLLTLAAALWAPQAGLVLVVVVGCVGLVWLGLLRRSEPPHTARSERRQRLLPPAGILPVTVAWIGVGAMFGSFDVTSIAWGDRTGSPWLAGVMMAALAVGNTAGALVYGALRLKASLRTRWLVGSALLAVVCLALPLAADGLLALLAAAAVGAVIGPVLVAGFALVEARADRDRVTELLAYPSLGVGAGIPLGSTLAGIGLDAAGPVVGFTVMAVSCVAIVVLGGLGEALLAMRSWGVPARRRRSA
ncbi:MFS transporter [Microbacterium trichothecenolyticum]|uniref:MFS family arabinose efflux permease n=1 Tax=Microbacterium trichothecenolyticum TaxID=69370 RepID=A0ABU0TW66_MICTR|nr:MFS transporter [Microbacterium trichothecenolyticum]MDQ1123184.1 putative MFS family arabinose efflux permease [Microbacterium trichothecenolyticum]